MVKKVIWSSTFNNTLHMSDVSELLPFPNYELSYNSYVNDIRCDLIIEVYK